VLVLGSGNVVHNLGGVDWANKDAGFDWAQRFDTDAKALLVEDPGNLTDLAGHRDWRSAVPTPDHLLPVYYLAGLASASGGGGAGVLVDGYAYGSLSMTSYVLGGNVAAETTGSGTAPLPPGVPQTRPTPELPIRPAARPAEPQGRVPGSHRRDPAGPVANAEGAASDDSGRSSLAGWQGLRSPKAAKRGAANNAAEHSHPLSPDAARRSQQRRAVAARPIRSRPWPRPTPKRPLWPRRCRRS